MNYFKVKTQSKYTILANEVAFSGSLVKDPVYHGTNKKFDEFKLMTGKRSVLFSEWETQAHGIFFTRSIEDAATYGKYVVECFINVKNPLVLKDRNLSQEAFEDIAEIAVPLVYEKGDFLSFELSSTSSRDLARRFGDGKYTSRYTKLPDTDPDFKKDMLYNYFRGQPWEIQHGVEWSWLDNKEFVDNLRKLGYDSTETSEPNDSDSSIFVLNTNQIKISKWI